MRAAESLRAYLTRIDPNLLKRKISRYEKLSRTVRTREQIAQDIYDVLLAADANGVSSLAFPVTTRRMPIGTKLYRARLLNHEDEVTQISHLWEAPPVYVSAGRLNIPREPLIYTAVHNQTTAAYEVRMKPGDIFAMIQYETLDDVSFAPIGEYQASKYLTLAETRKLDLIYGFMEDIFTQRRHPNKEHVYVAPEIIVKTFFDWPIEIAQGWGYKSIAEPGGKGFNLCFRPTLAKEYLRVDHVLIGRCEEFVNQMIRFSGLKAMVPIQGSPLLQEVPVVDYIS